MGSRRLVLAIVTLMLTIPLSAEKKHSGGPVEPTAGEWRTWTISSGKDYRSKLLPESTWNVRLAATIKLKN